MAKQSQRGVGWLSTLPLLSIDQRREVASAFRNALVESPLPALLTETVRGRILGCNAQFEQLLGVDETDLHGRAVEEFGHPDDLSNTAGVLARLLSGESTLEQYEARWVRPDGRVVWTRRHVLRIDGPTEDGAGHYIVGVMEDQTALRVAQQLASALVEIGTGIAAGASLEVTAERLTRLAEARWNQIGCILTVLDEERRVLVPVRPSRATGFLAEVPELPLGEAGGASGRAASLDQPAAVPSLLSDPQLNWLRPLLDRHDVHSSWAVPLHDDRGHVIGTLGAYHRYQHELSDDDWASLQAVAGVAAIAIIADKRRRTAAREQHRVRTDPRTGLLNDVALIEKLDAMLARREPVSVAVATLRGPGRLASLESTSRVALTTLATRAQALGQVPYVAVTGVTSLAFVARAEWGDREVRLLHRVLARPIDIGTAVVRPEVAVGVTVATPTNPAGGAEMLARATLAVPARGGSRIVEPEPADTATDGGLVTEVTDAFRRGDFVAYYQPQFDLVTGAVLGSEALVRWNHPQRGVLTPASFLPIIECTGASTELAFTMIRRAAADLPARTQAGLQGNVAINVTADDLLNESFLQVLRNPEDRLWRQISLELTEAQFARPEAVAALEELSALGFGIALDDFGTGYSALSMIHTLPVSFVKIDQSFVARLPHDSSAEALVAAITALCAQLTITVVAEGIETEQQARAVRDLGCRIGQGYLFGRPAPLEKLTPETLQQRSRHARSTRGQPPPPLGDAARRRLLELHQQGASPTTIAAALNRSGYRAAGGTRWHARSVALALNAEHA